MIESNNKNILLVDDSKFVLSIVKSTLEKADEIDVTIFTAESLQEAKELIAETSFHAAILDVNLPEKPAVHHHGSQTHLTKL